MSPRETIIRGAYAIRQTVTQTTFITREFSKWIEEAIADGGYATNGSTSEISLEESAKDLEEMGNSLIWLARGLQKRRFDLLQAGKAHNVVPLRAAE